MKSRGLREVVRKVVKLSTLFSIYKIKDIVSSTEMVLCPLLYFVKKLFISVKKFVKSIEN